METFGGIAVDVPASALSGFDAQLGAELGRWTVAEPGRVPDGFTLAWLVTARIRMVGRLRLWEPLLTVLADIRRRHAEHLRDHDPFTAAYLDAVLAGAPGSPDEPGSPDDESYLALPLLRLVAADRRSNLDPSRLGTLLLADLLWHEQFADPVDHPDPAAHARRTDRIAVCIEQNDPTMGTAVPAPPGTAAGEWLSLTALPMTTAHDEYLVIRVLQAYELVFAQLTDLVSRAAAARADRPALAAVLVRRAAHGFERATALAALLSGVRSDGLQSLTGPDGRPRPCLAAPAGYRHFERAVRALTSPADEIPAATGTEPAGAGHQREAAGHERAGNALSAAIAALEISRQVWQAAHDDAAGRLRPPPAAAPGRNRAARPPLVDRAALPPRVRVGTPITLRGLTPVPVPHRSRPTGGPELAP